MSILLAIGNSHEGRLGAARPAPQMATEDGEPPNCR
jgi:hypothetical protein